MKQFELVRFSTSNDGTLGFLLLHSLFVCYTLERPWLENKQQVSCIPTGLYNCEFFQSQSFGETYRLLNVKGRDGIIIHAGNSIKDSRGCILLGLEVASKSYISKSKMAIEKFIAHTEKDKAIQLKVSWLPSIDLSLYA